MREPLENISPIDGRYVEKCSPLAPYFSELALFKYRVRVEIEYFIALLEFLPEIQALSIGEKKSLRNIYFQFSLPDAQRIKEIERITNHDVKAVEYFIKEKIKDTTLEKHSEWIHFGLTSQDINNTSVPLSIKEAIEEVVLKKMEEILLLLKDKGRKYIDVPMLARTHGQAASPTGMGKEWLVFAERLEKQINAFKQIPLEGKFGGATGNFNAHMIAFPHLNWVTFANQFLENVLGLQRQQTTTQIEHYDQLAALLQNLIRINTILIDFCRDIWTYVSMDYFKQKTLKNEVGSSAMPHKVNPIDFENAEGNLGMSSAIADFMAQKLPVSRLQRDLTDSTVLRNIGLPFSYTYISLLSIEKGIGKLELNPDAIHADLENNYAVLAEAIQSVLRAVGYEQPYEKLKELTRGNNKVTANSLAEFINSLEINEDLKHSLLLLNPATYTGNATQL
jgi:adenylosuccinate lyase